MTTGGLTSADFSKAAALLTCEIAIIRAIVDIEGSQDGFLSTYEPLLWFHSDVFSRRTLGAYDRIAPDISNSDRADLGVLSAQYLRLQKAALFDRQAALMSASWGRFQLMGYNYALAGYHSVEEFVCAMYKDESAQLFAFVQYLISLSLDEDLRNKDWEAFAFKFKRSEERSAYITNLDVAYQKYTKGRVE